MKKRINLILGLVLILAGATSLKFPSSATTTFVYYTSIFIAVGCAVNILKIALGKREEGEKGLFDKISLVMSVVILVLAVVNLVYMATSVGEDGIKGNWLYVSVVYILLAMTAAAAAFAYNFLSVGLEYKIVGLVISGYSIGIAVFGIITINRSVEEFGNTLASSLILVGLLYIISVLAQEHSAARNEVNVSSESKNTECKEEKTENKEEKKEEKKNSPKEAQVSETKEEEKKQKTSERTREKKELTLEMPKVKDWYKND